MVAMAAIALAAIVAGNNSGNSSGDGSSGGSGGCNDKDISGYSDGGGRRQQSTKSGRGRKGGGDGDGNGDKNNDGKGNYGGALPREREIMHMERYRSRMKWV
jgi:hypothetical protein